MAEPKYIAGPLGETSACEGWYSVEGDTLTVYSFEKTVTTRGSTFVVSPGVAIKTITLEEGEDPRPIALRALQKHSLARRGHYGATGPLPYRDQGWF
jgi:hypothetical protein